jgi:uncharacterized protein (DUF1800 family)
MPSLLDNDVYEVARAFTGWRVNGSSGAPSTMAVFIKTPGTTKLTNVGKWVNANTRLYMTAIMLDHMASTPARPASSRVFAAG